MRVNGLKISIFNGIHKQDNSFSFNYIATLRVERPGAEVSEIYCSLSPPTGEKKEKPQTFGFIPEGTMVSKIIRIRSCGMLLVTRHCSRTAFQPYHFPLSFLVKGWKVSPLVSPEIEKGLQIIDLQAFSLHLGRPKQSIIEPHLPGLKGLNRVYDVGS